MLWIVIVVFVGALIGIGATADVKARVGESNGHFTTTREALAIGHIIWATVTTLVFVPAGFVLAILAFDHGEHAFFGALVAALGVSGLALARATLKLPRALATDDDETIGRVAVHGVIHHVAVMAVFALGFMIEPFDFRAILVPCAIGVGLAGFAAHHARDLETLPVEVLPRAIVTGKKL